jgi:hypothetical protein
VIHVHQIRLTSILARRLAPVLARATHQAGTDYVAATGVDVGEAELVELVDGLADDIALAVREAAVQVLVEDGPPPRSPS